MQQTTSKNFETAYNDDLASKGSFSILENMPPAPDRENSPEKKELQPGERLFSVTLINDHNDEIKNVDLYVKGFCKIDHTSFRLRAVLWDNPTQKIDARARSVEEAFKKVKEKVFA